MPGYTVSDTNSDDKTYAEYVFDYCIDAPENADATVAVYYINE
jgi:hypothetical protein